MVRLTDEERSFRKIGAGVPFGRFWHFPAILIALILAGSTVPDLYLNCTGNPIDGGRKAGAAIRMALTYPCSPYLLREGLWGWLLFAGLWLPIPFALINLFWQRVTAPFGTASARVSASAADNAGKNNANRRQ